MQRKIIFKSKCCFCDNDEFIEWKHNVCGGIQYLDTNGNITCNCNGMYNLLDVRCKCCKCKCGFHQLDNNSYNQLKTIINLILKKMNIDDDFKVELLYNITIRWHERYK